MHDPTEPADSSAETPPTRPLVGLWPASLAAVAALLSSWTILGCGAAMFAVLAVALNGFSESEAAPLFITLGCLLVLASLAVSAILSFAVLRNMQAADARFALLVVAGSAVGSTFMPIACVLVWLLTGGSL